MSYTIEEAIAAAAQRAARDREGAFAVYRDREGTIYMREARAAAPGSARLVAIAQFWAETEGRIEVQVRHPGATSEWRQVELEAPTADMPPDAAEHRWWLLNTWNGGAGGRVVVFESKAAGRDGYDECMRWLHSNTSFSVHEAITHQGYKIEPAPAPRK